MEIAGPTHKRQVTWDVCLHSVLSISVFHVPSAQTEQIINMPENAEILVLQVCAEGLVLLICAEALLAVSNGISDFCRFQISNTHSMHYKLLHAYFTVM